MAAAYIRRSLGSAGIGSSSGSSRSGLSSGMPSKPSPGLSRKAERASSRISRPSAEFKSSRNGLRRWAARPYKSSLSSFPMPLARDFESSPDNQPSPFGSKSRRKKEQGGFDQSRCGSDAEEGLPHPRQLLTGLGWQGLGHQSRQVIESSEWFVRFRRGDALCTIRKEFLNPSREVRMEVEDKAGKKGFNGFCDGVEQHLNRRWTSSTPEPPSLRIAESWSDATAQQRANGGSNPPRTTSAWSCPPKRQSSDSVLRGRRDGD